MRCIKSLSILMLAVFSLAGFNAIAGDKSLADNKIVLQITDNDPKKHTLVLNVATNLKKIYGQDQVDVEIVAFGPGLSLLTKKNKNAKRIDTIAATGVKFSACAETIRKMTKKKGKKPVLNKHAQVVKGGIIRIIDLNKQGYLLVRP